MRSLLIRWNGCLAQTSVAGSGLRMVVVYDKQTNGALPATTDVFAADQMSSPMNLANNRRFEVVMDEEIPCVGTGGPQAWNIKRYVKLNHVVEFNQVNGGTIAAGAGVVNAVGVRVAGCARDGVVVAAELNAGGVVRVAGCARDGVVAAAAGVVDAVVVAQEVKLV